MVKQLKNGLVIGADGELTTADIRIEQGRITAIGDSLAVQTEEKVIDVEGKLVIPGLIDLHIHLREPGFEAKETIATGTRAAAKGGYTTVACMPNTSPVTDSPQVVETILGRNRATGSGVRLLPIAAITCGLAGEKLTDMAALKEAGAVAVSDDGVGVQSPRMMKAAMREAARQGLPLVAHCEEEDLLIPGACVHDGPLAAKYGLPGIPSESESIHVGRDILLAEDTGVHYHVCHVSAESSVRLIREAKERGQQVTAEVTPHHLLLCDEDIPGPDPTFKMNPPLRSRRDREALLMALQDGTIDFIATDHAPHRLAEKERPMQDAPFGIVGLETAFPLLYTWLVLTGKLTLAQLVDKMTRVPAQRFGLPWGLLAEGAWADIAVIDLKQEQFIQPETFLSKGKNTPFSGWKVKGWPVLTLVEGEVVWAEDSIRV